MKELLKAAKVLLFEGEYLGGELLRLNDKIENYRWLRFMSDGVNPNVYDCPIIKLNDFYSGNPHAMFISANLSILIYKDRPFDIYIYPDNMPNKKVVRIYGIK